MTNFKRILSLILCIVLVAAIALFTTGCSDNKNNKEEPQNSQVENNKEELENNDEETTGEQSGVKELGEGKTSFEFVVKDIDGNETKFLIHTNKTVVGDALVELGLVEGEDSQYGLYVKKVNGIVADYDKDQTYWAFYVDGEYAMSGVDTTQIEEGKVYSFAVSK